MNCNNPNNLSIKLHMKSLDISVKFSKKKTANNTVSLACMFDCVTQYDYHRQLPPLHVKIYKYSYFLLQTLGTVSRILQQLDSENLALDNQSNFDKIIWN